MENGTVFDVSDARICYHVEGSSGVTPLVLVNGGPGFNHDYLHCTNAWSEIATTRRVVFYDQRGTGRSPAQSGAAMDLATQIEDLDAVRAHVGADRIDLLGHSWGGYVAMAYAARYPERIAHLVIANSAAPKWSETTILFDDVFPEVMAQRRATDFAQAMGDSRAAAEDTRLYLSMLFYASEKRDQFLANAGAYQCATTVYNAVMRDITNYDLTPELGKFTMPTLVLTGRHDMNVAPRVAWRIHGAISGSQLVVFERSGHLPFFEEPALFVKTIQEFLG